MKLFMKRCKPVTYVILFFASWQFLQLYNYAHAFKDNRQDSIGGRKLENRLASSKFEKKLKITHSLFTEMVEKLDQGSAVKNEIERIKGLKEELNKENDEVLRYFANIRKQLEDKKLPQVILDRHDKTVEEYQEKYKQLQKKLESVSKAKGKELKLALAEAVEFLDKCIHKKKHTPLDPNKLPHRMPEIKERKPRTTLKEYLKDKGSGIREQGSGIKEIGKIGFNNILPKEGVKIASLDISDLLANMVIGAIPPPGPADLAETVEVQFTQRIQDLAAELEHHPLKIYNWVKNNIEFVPTYGSIQGAEMCLMTKQGNAFDTSSLLIALLRASNVPARYVYGTVEIPIDKAMNWVGGVTDPIVAGQIFASCGIPARLMYKGEEVVSIQIEHVWVEAYVDYVPYRGAVHKEGDTWIPMDVSFKQYTYTEGIDFEQEVPFDAESFVEQVENTATINEEEGWATGVDFSLVETTVGNYKIQIENYINDNMPEATVGDVIGKKEIVQKQYPFLPATLPNRIVVKANRYAELPGYLKHSITFDLIKDPVWGTSDFSLTISLPELAGKKITLSYMPATQDDEDLINSLIPEPDENGNIDPDQLPQSLPAYLIHLKPELRIEGEVVATGSPILMGSEEKFNLTFYSPTGMGNDTISNIIIAGEYYGIALDLQAIPEEQVENLKARIEATKQDMENRNLANLTKDKIIGDVLYATAIAYFAELDSLNKVRSRSMGVIAQRFVSAGMFSSALMVNYILNTPRSARPSGFCMDIDRDYFQAISKDGDMARRSNYCLQSGVTSSYLEHSVPEKLFSTTENPVEGISAVKALSFASNQGIPIYTINVSNIDDILPQLQLDYKVISDIENAVNSGMVVTTSKTNITYNNWTGCGYIIIDPENGSGSYMISDGKNGTLLWWVLTIAIYACYIIQFAALAFTVGVFIYIVGVMLAPIITGLASILSSWYLEAGVFISSFYQEILAGTIIATVASAFWKCYQLGMPGSPPGEDTLWCTIILLEVILIEMYRKLKGI